MVRNREEAARAAEATTTNKVGMCQQITRGYYMGASAGDRDHDGDADAIDGWASEPEWAKHHNDRNPPRGVPVTFRNASHNGHGHRAESLGNGLIRSSDFSSRTKRYAAGVMGTGTIAEIERAMGLVYLGWSETITGEKIPLPPAPPPTRIQNFHKGGPQWDINILDRAISEGRKDIKPFRDEINKLVMSLPHDEGKTRVKAVVDAYRNKRILRMGLLNQAVDAGRKGKVKQVRDKLLHIIHHEMPRK